MTRPYASWGLEWVGVGRCWLGGGFPRKLGAPPLFLELQVEAIGRATRLLAQVPQGTLGGGTFVVRHGSFDLFAARHTN